MVFLLICIIHYFKVKQLLQNKVLKNRLNIIKSFREKEWWFSYLYDKNENLFFSWFFIRAFTADHFNFLCFDIKNMKKYNFEKTLFFDKRNANSELDLQFHSNKLNFQFTGDYNNNKFIFDNNKFTINLNLTKSDVPGFIKRDNYFTNIYALYHNYKQKIEGTIKLEDKEYKVCTDHSYFDHCFGKVPRNTGWHWIAVQNKQTCLSSLVNYGVNAQKYTQVYLNNKWIRLNQDVSFEYSLKNKFDFWKITSADMDLDVKIVDYYLKKVNIPPLIPFMVKIDHKEFFVRISGKIKIEGKWIEINDLEGVMEEHNGKW